MKGRTNTKVYDQRSIDHLDPTSDRHKEDQVEYRKVRQAHSLNWMEESRSSYLLEEKFKSLGDGLILDPDGNEITSEQYQDSVKSVIENRSYYWLHYIEKKSGKQKRRRIKGSKKNPLRPIRQIAVTFRPDHSLGLHEVDQKSTTETAAKLLREFIRRSALECSRSFSEETNYDVIATEVHPNEGCLHFHILYATISNDNKLLHTSSSELGTRKRGNPDIRLAGPCQIGLERARTNGIPIPNEELHLEFLRDKIRQGELPADLKMSEVLDGCVERLQMENPQVRPIFDECFDLWLKAKTGKWRSKSKGQEPAEAKIDRETIKVGDIEIEQ